MNSCPATHPAGEPFSHSSAQGHPVSPARPQHLSCEKTAEQGRKGGVREGETGGFSGPGTRRGAVPTWSHVSLMAILNTPTNMIALVSGEETETQRHQATGWGQTFHPRQGSGSSPRPLRGHHPASPWPSSPGSNWPCCTFQPLAPILPFWVAPIKCNGHSWQRWTLPTNPPVVTQAGRDGGDSFFPGNHPQSDFSSGVTHAKAETAHVDPAIGSCDVEIRALKDSADGTGDAKQFSGQGGPTWLLRTTRVAWPALRKQHSRVLPWSIPRKNPKLQTPPSGQVTAWSKSSICT